MEGNSLWINKHRKIRLLKNFKILDVGWGWERHRAMDN